MDCKPIIIDSSAPILQAARNGQLNQVALFLRDPNVDPTVVDRDYESALCLATKNGNMEMVKVLLQHPRILPDVGVLEVACRYNRPEIAKLFLEDPNLENPSENENMALKSACAKGSLECIQLLIHDERLILNSETCLDILLEAKSTFSVIKLLLQDARFRKKEFQLAYIQILFLAKRCCEDDLVTFLENLLLE